MDILQRMKQEDREAITHLEHQQEEVERIEERIETIRERELHPQIKDSDLIQLYSELVEYEYFNALFEVAHRIEVTSYNAYERLKRLADTKEVITALEDEREIGLSDGDFYE